VKHYNVIIIGSGINSLSAALFLGKAGKKVLILEKRDQIGGMASTIEFTPGYKCNLIHDTIKWINPKLLKELNTNSHDIKIIEPEINHIALGKTNENIFFHRDSYKTASSIRKLSEKDAENWKNFTLYIKKLTEFLERVYNVTPPNLPNIGLAEVLSMRPILNPILKHGTQGVVDLLRVVPMMMPEMMDEWFENDLLRGALSAIGVRHSSLGPFAASTGYNFLHQHLYSNGSIYNNHFIKGGTVNFAKAIQKLSESYNIEFRLNSKVKSINLDNGVCKGVTTENEDIIEADIVVSGLDPKNTFMTLVGTQNLNPDFYTQLRNIRYRGSVARIHFALKGLPKIKNVLSKNMDTMFSICPSIEYLEKTSDAVKYGKVPDNPYIEFCFPSVINPEFAPKEKHVISATIQYIPYNLRNQIWNNETNKNLEKNIIQILEKSIPGFEDLIESSAVFSPKNLEEEFELSEGNFNHGEMTLDQFMFMRPTISTAQYKAPFKNLYLCGSGTHPGGGLHGTNGLNAAKEILKK